jgi:CDP-diacylglycerol--glycerol-3-phosphate 3-phosphatidyltransferase
LTTDSPAGALVRYVTVPNVISIVRLTAAPGLIVLAALEMGMAFLALSILLLLTDWVDGRIARAWKQETTFGARLDAISDVAIYVCIAVGIWLLRPEEFWAERYWLMTIVASYLLSLAVCFAKFGCLPNYHTRLAKTSWLLVTVGVIAFIVGYVWPIRLAMAVVIAANFESIAVTLALRQWRTDVNSLAEAMKSPEKPTK